MRFEQARIEGGKRRAPGFTLIELMVALAVAAIILTIGVPAFTSMIKNHRQSVRANEVLAAVYLARSEAIKRNHAISLCGSSAGTKCDGGWAAGWLVYDDANANGKVDVGEAIRSFRARAGATIAASLDPILFGSDGAVASAASITICDDRGAAHARTVCIESSGSGHVSQEGCFGGAISCP